MTMDNTNETTTTQDQTIALIDEAINQAKAKKAQTPRKPALSAEERDAAKAQKLAEREAKKAARELAKANRPERKKAHLSKVEKAQAALPSLSEDATRLFNQVTSEISSADCTALAQHLIHFVRVQRTLAATANTSELSPGQQVRITGGDPRFIGLTGTVNKSQRIRCYVDVPGRNKPVYLFTSDCEVIA
jgi:hypothetical protein